MKFYIPGLKITRILPKRWYIIIKIIICNRKVSNFPGLTITTNICSIILTGHGIPALIMKETNLVCNFFFRQGSGDWLGNFVSTALQIVSLLASVLGDGSETSQPTVDR